MVSERSEFALWLPKNDAADQEGSDTPPLAGVSLSTQQCDGHCPLDCWLNGFYSTDSSRGRGYNKLAAECSPHTSGWLSHSWPQTFQILFGSALSSPGRHWWMWAPSKGIVDKESRLFRSYLFITPCERDSWCKWTAYTELADYWTALTTKIDLYDYFNRFTR